MWNGTEEEDSLLLLIHFLTKFQKRLQEKSDETNFEMKKILIIGKLFDQSCIEIEIVLEEIFNPFNRLAAQQLATEFTV